MKNFNAVSHNRARPYFRIQHGRGEVRARRVYLNVHSVTGNVVHTEWSVEFLAMEMLQGAWKQHLRPRAVVGYGVKIFLPSPPNYVTRSLGDLLDSLSDQWIRNLFQVLLSFESFRSYSPHNTIFRRWWSWWSHNLGSHIISPRINRERARSGGRWLHPQIFSQVRTFSLALRHFCPRPWVGFL